MEKTAKWYMHQSKYDDVIIASRVRLVRNLAAFDFADKISARDSEKLVEKVRALTPDIAGREGKDFFSCDLTRISPLDRQALVESQATAPQLAERKKPCGIILSADESVCIEINGEDHIGINCVVPGGDMRLAWETANRLDDFLDSNLQYAYSDRYGYLTTNLSNIGTGLHASYLLSLPALTLSSKIESLQEEVGKFGVVIQNLYEDGAKNAGFMYRVSNRKTLGSSEQELIDHLDQIVTQIAVLERKRRESWLEADRNEIEDKVCRSYGVLRYAKLITTRDAMLLLGQLKLGMDLNLIKTSFNGSDIHRLMIEVQPAMLQKLLRKKMDEQECALERAIYLNGSIPQITV